MKIALLNTPSLFAYGKIKSGNNSSFPLGLGYIASYVRKEGHQVKMFDPEPYQMAINDLWNLIKIFQPDIIGITSVTSNFMLAQQLVKNAKEIIGCYVIMGGPHVNALPHSSLIKCSPYLDAVILGEGEIPMLSIARYFNKHGCIDFNVIPGSAYINRGRYYENTKPELLKNLDTLPYPARDLVNMNLYKLHPHFRRGRKSATILTSRGCPSRCTFCANLCMGRNFRANSAKYIIGEMEHLINTYNIKHFHFVDDCFTASSKRVHEICDLIISKNLKVTWFIFGRVNNLQDNDLIQKMKQAGCVYVLLGIETGNQEINKLMKKGTTLIMDEKCCNLLKKNKIRYFNSYIIGNEGDSWDTVLETITFSKKLKSVMAGFNMLIPFPGTEIFNKYYIDYDRPDINWNNWCSVGDDLPYEPRHTQLSRNEILYLTSYAYRKFYFNFLQIFRILMFAKNPKQLLSYFKASLSLLNQMFSWFRKSRTI
jgi:anaerobic magnesium-protoporphyrin IX monomethyl ester cyclase